MPPVPDPARHTRPLPRRLRPVHHETIDSYLARLAAANHLPAEVLVTFLGASLGLRTRALLPRLAIASQQPPASLSRALVEFEHLGTTPTFRAAWPHRWNRYGVALDACQPCMAARGITVRVVIFIAFYQRVCHRHRRWLDRNQIDLTNAPEVIHAQRRQRRISRRHGVADARRAYSEAGQIVDRWLRRGDPASLHERWAQRLNSLGESRRVLEFNDPMLNAVTHPETVALSSVLASAFWTSMATSEHAVNRDRFYEEAARRLSVPSLHPSDGHDPLFRWSVDRAVEEAERRDGSVR